MPGAVGAALRAEGVLIKPLAALAAAAALVVASDLGLGRTWPARFPPLSEVGSGPYALQDALLSAAGFRAAAADLAWVQLLQYAAGNAPPELADEPGKPYGRLKALSLRVGRLDPSFHRAFLYGAGMLGWFRGVEDPAGAAEVLREGMRLAPEEPLFPEYLAALAYKQKGDVAGMTATLESSFDAPQTPTTMKTILANLRKSRGDYAGALALWRRILDNPRDAAEHPRARQQAAELERLLRARRS